LNRYQKMSDAAVDEALHKKEQREKIRRSPWKFHTGEPAPPLRWLVKYILPEIGVALASGQWGLFKTTAALDLCVSVMIDKPFAGTYRIKRHGAVLYIAVEGAGGLLNRLEAIAGHRGFTGPLPFAWRDDCPALTDDDAAEILCALADDAKAEFQTKFNLPIVLIVIDTVIVAAQHKEGGDNDTAASQKVIKAMSDLAKHTGAMVMGVDHFGKAIETGTRGSSAKEGGVDAILALLGDREMSGEVKNTRMAMRKQRDGLTGFEIPFAVCVLNVGEDEDGDPITAQVIDWKAPQPAEAKSNTNWTKTMRTLRRVLTTILADHGKTEVPFIDGPQVRACDIELVRDEFYRQHVAEGTEKKKSEARRKAFNRAVDDGKDRGVIGVREVSGVKLIWLTKEGLSNHASDDF
jgi:hypothetical protein